MMGIVMIVMMAAMGGMILGTGWVALRRRTRDREPEDRRT
jgi:LPS O-antigen subunit length determinant protein (WzzB/FepE family)